MWKIRWLAAAVFGTWLVEGKRCGDGRLARWVISLRFWKRGAVVPRTMIRWMGRRALRRVCASTLQKCTIEDVYFLWAAHDGQGLLQSANGTIAIFSGVRGLCIGMEIGIALLLKAGGVDWTLWRLEKLAREHIVADAD